jgi:secreted Zn-dependent insulinase-like peptidase
VEDITPELFEGHGVFMVVEHLPAPIKGKADWRDFRCIKLENGVTVCLVHDKESKTTAAAATVNVGAAADPREMSGLART